MTDHWFHRAMVAFAAMAVGVAADQGDWFVLGLAAVVTVFLVCTDDERDSWYEYGDFTRGDE